MDILNSLKNGPSQSLCPNFTRRVNTRVARVRENKWVKEAGTLPATALDKSTTYFSQWERKSSKKVLRKPCYSEKF